MTSRMEDAANAVSLGNVSWVINQNIVVEQVESAGYWDQRIHCYLVQPDDSS